MSLNTETNQEQSPAEETSITSNLMESLWGLADESRDVPSQETAQEENDSPAPAETSGVPHHERSLKDILEAGDVDEVKPDDGSGEVLEEVKGEGKEERSEAERKPVKIIKRKESSSDDDYVNNLPEFKPATVEDRDETLPDWSEFSEEEQDSLEVAHFAAKHMSDKYPELDKKLSEYFRKHKQFVEEKSEEDPDYDFSPSNPEYRKFVEKNKPKFTQVDYRRIEREKIAHEISKQKDEEIARLREDIRRTKEAPEVDQKAEQFTKQLKDEVLPDEIAALKDETKAREEYPLEFEIVDQVVQEVADSSKLFLRISRQLERFDETNPVHIRLAEDVESIGQDFLRNGGKARIQNGKQFLPRSEYRKAYHAGQADKYWTFTDEQVLDQMKKKARNSIQSRVETERKRLERLGFIRKPKEAEKKESPKTSSPLVSPKATPSRSPGPVKPTDGGSDSRITSLLGF